MSVVKINAIEVPSDERPKFERRYIDRAGTIDDAPGFLGFQLLRPVAGEDRYFVVTRWDTDESYAAWRDGSALAAHTGEHGKAALTGATVLEFQVVIDVEPKH